jgi:hypothetical protein
MDGEPDAVVNRYVGLVHEWETRHKARPSGGEKGLAASNRHGDRTSRIVSVTLHDETGGQTGVVSNGAMVTVRVRAEFLADCVEPMVGILVRNRLGIDVFGTNTRVEGMKLGECRTGDTVEVDFRFPCMLAQQDYALTAATQHWEGASQDWLDGVLSFTVVDRRPGAGIASFPVEVQMQKVETAAGAARP